nr:MAG TPA: FeoB-associated Cys-rich membrane protein [Caudoviricetes sp.]
MKQFIEITTIFIGIITILVGAYGIYSLRK